MAYVNITFENEKHGKLHATILYMQQFFKMTSGILVKTSAES